MFSGVPSICVVGLSHDTFLYTALKIYRCIGLGHRMMSWIRAIYSRPSAIVKVNSFLSNPLEITNGTHQGCPLSPLIFVLTLEPFLRTIRANVDIEGLSISASLAPKVAAYVDDLLFFLFKPLISLPNLMREFRVHEALSSYKINHQKSEALPVAMLPALYNLPWTDFPFKWSSLHIKYLGISLPNCPAYIFNCNFPPLLAGRT